MKRRVTYLFKEPSEILGSNNCFHKQKLIKQRKSLQFILNEFKMFCPKVVEKYYNRVTNDKSRIYDEEEWKW